MLLRLVDKDDLSKAHVVVWTRQTEREEKERWASWSWEQHIINKMSETLVHASQCSG